jgi:hypothetical protein
MHISSTVVTPWRCLQFVAEMLWKSIKTNHAIGWKQTIVFNKISREMYNIKFNASVCSVEVSYALKMDALTFRENWTVFVTLPGVIFQQMTPPRSGGAEMCFNCTKKL